MHPARPPTWARVLPPNAVADDAGVAASHPPAALAQPKAPEVRLRLAFVVADHAAWEAAATATPQAETCARPAHTHTAPRLHYACASRQMA